MQIIDSSDDIAPSAPKPRQVISLLALRPNSVVSVSELVDELWRNDPPISALTTLQTYIYKIRKILIQRGMGDRLITRQGGYMLAVPDSAIDARRFELKVSRGRKALASGDLTRGADILTDALEIWRGPALADVVTGSLLSAYVTRLEESRFHALQTRIETDLRLGRHLQLIGELKSLAAAHPLHERLHGSLMLALHRSGRRHEALAAFRAIRRNLVDQLGVEPAGELQRLHRELLSSAPVAAPARHGHPVRNGCPSDPAAPARLPPDVGDFTGRRVVLEKIAGFLRGERDDAAHDPPGAPRVVAITGSPGVGKSTLAVRLAHALRQQRFADVQLYAELGGSTGTSSEPARVISGFLRALGVPGHRVPAALAERRALLRSVVAGRRLLFILDDAASPDQVRALLPGEPGCAAIVTSRRRLTALAGVRNVVLDVLGREESAELLSRIVGRRRLEREPTAAQRLVEASDGLPLALRCIGSRLTAIPEYSLAEMAEHFAVPWRALDALRFADMDVRSRFDSSYACLARVEQGTFQLISTIPDAVFTANDVADLLGWSAQNSRRVLERLIECHLLAYADADADADADVGEVRYALPRMTRIYARELLTSALVSTG